VILNKVDLVGELSDSLNEIDGVEVEDIEWVVE
jgi:hypothetical protein